MDIPVFCIDISNLNTSKPLLITKFDGSDAPSGLNRHEAIAKSTSKDDFLAAAKELYPDREFIFGNGF